MFAILHIKKKKKEIPIQIQRLTLFPGGQKHCPRQFSRAGAKGQPNNGAWAQVHRVGGLCGPESGYAYQFQRRLQELIFRLLAQAVNKDSRGGGFTPSKDSNLL